MNTKLTVEEIHIISILRHNRTVALNLNKMEVYWMMDERIKELTKGEDENTILGYGRKE